MTLATVRSTAPLKSAFMREVDRIKPDIHVAAYLLDTDPIGTVSGGLVVFPTHACAEELSWPSCVT